MSQQKIQDEIRNITDQLVANYHPQKIILFGSATKNYSTPPNDLDFVIIKKDVPHFGTDRMREVRTFIDTDIATDLLVVKPDEWEERLRLGDPFVKSINQNGKVLYG